MRFDSPWATHFLRPRGSVGSPAALISASPSPMRALSLQSTAVALSVLLIRPDPGNERFGLGPFFRVEPLGLEYVAAALQSRGHPSTIIDLRFSRRVAPWVRRTRPRLVGISCMHALEYDRVRATAREIRRLSPESFILVGGHAAAAFPGPLEAP